MSKQVVVIGGSGKVGRHIIRHLLEAGYSVRNVDQHPLADGDACPTVIADVRDAGQVYVTVESADAIVHLFICQV